MLDNIHINDLISHLSKNNIYKFKIDYSGSDDSGQIDSVSLINKDNENDNDENNFHDIEVDERGILISYGRYDNSYYSNESILDEEVKTYILCTEFEKENFGTILKEDYLKLYDLLSTLGYNLIDKYQRGFENNSGGFGHFLVEISDGKLTISNEHSYYVVETENKEGSLNREDNANLIRKLLKEGSEDGSSN